MSEKNAARGGESGQVNIMLIIGCLVIVALVGVIIALVLNMNREPRVVIVQEEPEVKERAVLVTEDNAEEMIQEMVEEPPANVPMYYSALMNTTWHFPDGASESTDAYVGNQEGNETPIYFDVILSDTEETIYQSPVIPLGGTLRNFKLDTDLDAGTYDCVCVYHLIDENQRTLTTLSMAVTVIVES